MDFDSNKVGKGRIKMSLTFEDIDKLYKSWDREKHKHLIEYVADTLKCKKMQDVPSIYISWCINKAMSDRWTGSIEVIEK